jgi:transposase
VAHLNVDQLSGMDRERLRALPRDDLEELTWQLVEVARSLAEKVKQNSTNSSRPPSSDDPYRRRDERQKAKDIKPNSGDDAGGDDAGSPPSGTIQPGTTDKKPSKPSGKRPGMPGFWRRQPMVVSRTVDHDAAACAACGATLGAAQRCRQDSAHYVYDLERAPMALQISAAKHRYFVSRCTCGHETVARPGTGRCSEIEGRRRNLQLTERCLLGPALASFIAILSIRFRLSRQKIQEFVDDWLGLELGTASIDRCIREFGLACEPVVEELVEEIRSAEVVHLDETPWYQRGALLWLWVAVSATAVVFHIASRAKHELTALIGEAFLGWLVTDGYTAYRDHPRRQRCLAHLIRKAVALAEGYDRPGSAFGRDLVRDLRRLIEKVAANRCDASVKRLLSRLKWNCQCHQHEAEDKVRALAREILNDWEAVIAFVHDPRLPPTNNDAERALRHAVIARRIGFGTRTDEGSRCYAAALSVIETCRKRGLDVASYARDLIATARKGLPHPPIPLAQPP